MGSSDGSENYEVEYVHNEEQQKRALTMMIIIDKLPITFVDDGFVKFLER